eukprot:scaffold1137_cov392-Pavlova_lutheri.AAC.16
MPDADRSKCRKSGLFIPVQIVVVRYRYSTCGRASGSSKGFEAGVRVPVPQPRASLTLDEYVSENTAASIRPGVRARSERLAFATARATTPACTERGSRICAVDTLAKRGPEPFPLDGVLVLAVLALFDVADRDDDRLRPAKRLWEPC